MPPGGEYGGEKFRCRRQPFANRFLEQIELAEQGLVPWTDFVWTGCTQCVAGETLILDPTTGVETSIRELAEAGKPITVLTMSGPQVVAAPFLKGHDHLYRVTTTTGRSFVATAKHQVLSKSGWLRVGEFDESSPPILEIAGSVIGEQVASREYVRTDDFYDMVVPDANHYFAQGFWHHNSGKTTLGLIVLMYVVFELKEQIIFGIPTMVLAKKKWKKDIRPMIAASQYGRYLPTRGPSSQGGSTIDELYFKHGPSLTFMSAAGGREQRSSDTARWILVTEADSFSELDEAGGEGRKIDQLFARTHAFGDRRRALAECTVTTDDAFVWDTYDKKSSRSELVCQCEACLQWVRLERQHLSGWQDGKSQLDAGRLARWECPNPECGHLFDDVERKHMVAGSKLRHVGQVILPDGTITGPVPETRTLGFRWNAFDNILAWKSAFIAENEYAAAKSKTPEQSGVAIGQFWWAQPRESDAVDLLSLDPQKIQDRVIHFTKDLIPADAELVVLGGDMGKRNLHWVLIAIRPGNRIHVCSYGMVPVPYEQMQLNLALQSAMMSLRERVNRGWPVEGRSVDDVMVPGQVFMDSGWGDYADLVYGMCAEFGVRWKAIKGYGFGQGAGFSSTSYHAPSGTGATVKLIGSGWHLVELDSQGFQLIHIDANYWKSRLQTAIVSDADSPGSVTLFDGTTNEHNEYTQHLCSERARIKSKWIAGHLDQREVWERVHKKNHYLDATCYGLAAADFLRFLRDLPKEGTPAASNDRTPVIVRPDGRPFVVQGGRT